MSPIHFGMWLTCCRWPITRLTHLFGGVTIALSCLGGVSSAGTIAYRSMVLGDNPIVYYEFDEVGGTTLVNSASTGTLYNGAFNTSLGTLTVNQPSFSDGGTSYQFNGGFVTATAITNSLTEWTVEAWVNYDASKSSASNFLSNDQPDWNNDVLIGIGPEEGTQVPAGNFGVVQQGRGASTGRDFAGAPLAAGAWRHVAVIGSATAGTLSVFIDGVLAASDTALINGVTFNGADGFGTATLVVGASRPDGLRPYRGLLDEVAIYDYVLTPAQLTAHATITPIPEPSTYFLALAGLACGVYSLFGRRKRG